MKLKRLIASGIRRLVEWLTRISYLRLGVMYGSMIVLFGSVYFAMQIFSPANAPNLGGGPLWIQFLNGIYFSIITAASVGYGDIYPHGISKILASFESLTSLFVFAILVSKPISERQEAALYQMHKLTLDEIFTSIREGFFVMRKDFDGIMEEVRTTGTLSAHGKENFETALHQGEVLLEDIPTFYDNEKKLYIIDMRREKLLGEAVERTFERLLRTVNVLQTQHVTLTERTQTILAELLKIGSENLKQWRKHSSKSVHPMIERSMELLTEIGKVQL